MTVAEIIEEKRRVLYWLVDRNPADRRLKRYLVLLNRFVENWKKGLDRRKAARYKRSRGVSHVSAASEKAAARRNS